MKVTAKDNFEYPMRINKFLYQSGVCSRRKADKLIEHSSVLINGAPAVLGQKVNKGDTVELKDFAQKVVKGHEYYVFNKPKGVVTTNPQRGEKDIGAFFKKANMSAGEFKRLSPVGRLDKDSHGLVFLTNDGRIVNKMLHPDFHHEKEYIVKVNKPLKKSDLTKLSKGVYIEGYKTKPAIVDQLDENIFSLTLTEGKKHQIRRMVTALGYEVRDLKRIRIMNITLGNIQPGEARELTPEEQTTLLTSLGY